jgi:hypothetical protein
MQPVWPWPNQKHTSTATPANLDALVEVYELACSLGVQFTATVAQNSETTAPLVLLRLDVRGRVPHVRPGDQPFAARAFAIASLVGPRALSTNPSGLRTTIQRLLWRQDR